MEGADLVHVDQASNRSIFVGEGTLDPHDRKNPITTRSPRFEGPRVSALRRPPHRRFEHLMQKSLVRLLSLRREDPQLV